MKKMMIVLSVLLLFVIAGAALWYVFGPRIPLDEAGNLLVDIPEKFSLKQDIFSSVLANLEQGRIVGKAAFVPGDYPVPVSGETYRLLISDQSPTVEYRIDFRCETLSASEGKVTLKPVIAELSFVFSPRMGIVSPQGLKVDIEKIDFSDNVDLKKLAVSTDLRIGESLASFLLYLFINPGEGSADQTALQWLSMFSDIGVATCRLALNEGASIPFNKNTFVTGKPCEVVLRDFSLRDANNLEGVVSVNLTLSGGSLFDLGEMVLRPDSGTIVFDGTFSMRDRVLSVKVSEQSEANFITIRNVRLRQAGDATQDIQQRSVIASKNVLSPEVPAGGTSSPSRKTLSEPQSQQKPQTPQKTRQSNATATEQNIAHREMPAETRLAVNIEEVTFQLVNYEYTSDPEQGKEMTRLELLSSLTTGKGTIPLDNGILAFSSLRVPDFRFLVEENAAVPGAGSTLVFPSLTFENARLTLEQAAEEMIVIDMKHFQSHNVSIKGWQDGQLTIDTTKISLSRVVLQRKHDTIDISMGTDSHIELGKNNLRFLLNPSKAKKGGQGREQANLIGKMHIRGTVPTLAAKISGSDFQFDRVRIDLHVNMTKQPSVDGSFSADIPAKTIEASLTDIPAPEVKNMQFNTPALTNIGAMKFGGQLKLAGETNSSRFDISMEQVADVLLTGKALRNSDINLQVFCAAFQTTIHLGEETGTFSLAMALKNNLSTCIHEEKKKILTGTATERFYLDPFDTLHLNVQGDVTFANNSLIVKPRSWQQTNDRKIVIRASGDVGSHLLSASLSDKKASCRVFGIDLPEWVCPGNLLRDELNKLCKKEFVIKL